MKNKILSILVVLFVLSTCVFTLTACENKDKCVNKNGHAYGQWVSNGDGTHTRVCAYDMSHQETLNCGGGTATCTQKAVCAICLQLYGEPKGHSIVIDQGVASTCTETGLTEGSHCKTCGEVLVEQNNVDIVPHNYNKSICSYCGISNLAFELNASGTAYTVEGVGSCNETEIIIPATFSGKPVTSINSFAFDNCDSLTSVVIPNGVTSIGSSAFHDCSSLTSVVIPDSVTTIGDDAFYYCRSLTSVVIPDGVTSIGSYAFSGCSSLTSVNYTGTIDKWAEILFGNAYANPLYYANQLKINGEVVTEVNLTSATKVSSAAFSNCSSLTSVVIPDSVTSIGDSAFRGCSSLTSVVIPDSVTSIGSAAFYNCSSLTSVVIGDSVTTIGNYAFYNCDSLTSIIIPDSVTSIGSYAFYFCENLTSVVIPDSVTTIGDSAFRFCSSLKSIVIPGSVTSIGYEAFYFCENLTSVVIPDSVTSIGSYAFAFCSSLTSVVIGDSVTSIGSYAFYGCSGLTSVVIPDSVTSINYCAFYGCSGLTSIKYRGTQAQWNKITKGSHWNSSTGNYTITYNYTGK